MCPPGHIGLADRFSSNTGPIATSFFLMHMLKEIQFYSVSTWCYLESKQEIGGQEFFPKFGPSLFADSCSIQNGDVTLHMPTHARARAHACIQTHKFIYVLSPKTYSLVIYNIHYQLHKP